MTVCTGLEIETTSACNAKCAFCFRAKKPIPAITMSDEVFEKIVKENTSGNYILYMRGEPLCDSKIVERVKYIKSINDKSNVFFHTNGGLLTNKICDDLVAAKLSYLVVSCYGLHALHDELQPGVSFQHVWEQVEYLRQKNFRVIIVSNLVDPRIDSAQVIDFWSKMGCTVVMDSALDWGSGEQASEHQANSNRCNVAHDHRLFGSDGSFHTCCIDYQGRNIFGNIKNETWEQGRERLRTLDLPFCSTCKFKEQFDTWRKS